MASIAARPTFFEGQILAAADLAAIGDGLRAHDERHQRLVHRPGIVTGLTLTAEDAKDASGASYKRLFVEPGLAIDDLGREILVSDRIELDAARFAVTIGASADATSLYPVLLRSVYSAAAPSGNSVGACATGASSRIQEGVDVTVARPTEVPLTDPQPVALSSDPSPAEGVGPPLLLGFAQWDPATNQFTGTLDSGGGAHRRYSGINASVVAGTGGLLLQPDPTSAAGSLAVEFDGADGELRFGPLVAGGTIADPLFKVDKDGNVTAKGTLGGRAAPGTTHYGGGLASDGLILPLPPGVAEDQIASGEATLQIVVSPEIDPANAPDPTLFWAGLTEECRVDADRRLHCRIAWMSLDFAAGNQGAQLVSAPGAARYLIVASVAAGGS